MATVEDYTEICVLTATSKCKEDPNDTAVTCVDVTAKGKS